MTTQPQRIPVTRAGLFARLAELGIETRTVDHAAAFTVEDSTGLARELPGGHTKNLFLKDEDGQLILVIAEVSTRVDLKQLAKTLRIGRLSFGKPDVLQDALGVPPGSVTAFAVINDTARRVRVIMDAALMRHDSMNCHPLENTATTNIAREDVLRFIRACGHEPRVVQLAPGT